MANAKNGYWFSLENGVHIFVPDGESPEEAVKDFTKKVKGKKGKFDYSWEREDKEQELESSNKTVNNQQKEITQPKQEKQFTELPNRDIDWDLVEENEKKNGNKGKSPTRKDKYGNPKLSDEAFKAGYESGKKYIDYMAQFGKDGTVNNLLTSSTFLDGIENYVSKGIYEGGYNPNSDGTYDDYMEIIGALLNRNIKLNERGGYAVDGNSPYTGYNPLKEPQAVQKENNKKYRVFNGEQPTEKEIKAMGNFDNLYNKGNYGSIYDLTPEETNKIKPNKDTITSYTKNEDLEKLDNWFKDNGIDIENAKPYALTGFIANAIKNGKLGFNLDQNNKDNIKDKVFSQVDNPRDADAVKQDGRYYVAEQLLSRLRSMKKNNNSYDDWNKW